MGAELIVAVVPALIIAAVLYVYFSARFKEHAELITTLREHLDRSEKELASLERQASGMSRELSRLKEEMGRARSASGEDHQELLQRFEALREEYDILEKKMEHVQNESISGESAKQLMESPLVGEILELLKQGVSPMEIAQRKGMQVGEITLIKSLQKFTPKG